MEQTDDGRMDGSMELGLKITLPRGVPVETFVALCRALEEIIRQFVEAVGLPGEQVAIGIGPVEVANGGEGSNAEGEGASPPNPLSRARNDAGLVEGENGGEGSNAQGETEEE